MIRLQLITFVSMIISAIVALDQRNAIGKDGKLPWHLPNDLRFFKKTTMGKPLLMGRKTFESMNGPLSGRTNIVLSQNPDFKPPKDVIRVTNIPDGLQILRQLATDEGFIIGGGQIFAETLHLLDRLYITRIHTIIDDPDTVFPSFSPGNWRETWKEEHTADDRHRYNYTFLRLERIRK